MRRYATHITLAIVYLAAYWGCYVSFLNANFEYAGVDVFRREPWFLWGSIATALLPSLFFRGVRAISSVIAVLVYLVLYIPIIVAFTLGSTKPIDEIMLVHGTFLLGMILLFMCDAVIIRSPIDLSLKLDLMPVALVVTIASTVYVVLVFRGNLHWSGFGDALYEQRSESAAIGSDIVTRYLTSWLATVLTPLCLAYGLVQRSWRYALAGLVASVVMYMAAANKTSILLPAVYVAFYLVTRRGFQNFFVTITASLAATMVAILVFGPTPGSALFVATSILLNRTIGNGGQLAVSYYDFFTYYPQTDYSHVNGINLFTHPYPYGERIIGQVVGNYYWSPLANTNASFWATDGIAAMGLVGVLIASCACAALLIVMNTVTRQDDRRFVALCFLSFVVTLLNQSLFSSIWSGGGLFLMIFFVLNPQQPAMTHRASALTEPLGVIS